MKKYVIIFILLNFGSLIAQSNKPETGPIIDDYGASYKIKKAECILIGNFYVIKS